MQVLFNTYSTAFHLPSGGERQIMDFREALPAQGIRAHLFDQWTPEFEDVDLVHYFSATAGSIHFCTYVRQLGLPLLLSPNLWITPETAAQYPLEEIGQILSVANRILLNSQIEANHFQNIFNLPSNKISVIYNAVSTKFLEPVNPLLIREILKLEDPFVLTVGSISPHKNQLSLIRALKLFPHLKLLLMGNIRDDEYAKQCIEEGGEQVIYVGTVPHGTTFLRSAMAACQALVIPSQAEAPSMAALEAAAQGAPIIITEIGSSKEYFGELAYYIDPKDPSTIVTALNNVLSSRPSPDPIKNLINERHHLTHAATQLAEIYRSMAYR
jgi:glycosyltransferase involved in cell wall biosynthesis